MEPHRNPATVKYEYSAVIMLCQWQPILPAEETSVLCAYEGIGIVKPKTFSDTKTCSKIQDFAAIIIQCTFKTLEQEENV